MSWRQRAIGIVVGLVLGIAIVILFIFYGSEETIDAPSIEGDRPPLERPEAEPAIPEQEAEPGSAAPESGIEGGGEGASARAAFTAA